MTISISDTEVIHKAHIVRPLFAQLDTTLHTHGPTLTATHLFKIKCYAQDARDYFHDILLQTLTSPVDYRVDASCYPVLSELYPSFAGALGDPFGGVVSVGYPGEEEGHADADADADECEGEGGGRGNGGEGQGGEGEGGGKGRGSGTLESVEKLAILILFSEHMIAYCDSRWDAVDTTSVDFLSLLDRTMDLDLEFSMATDNAGEGEGEEDDVIVDEVTESRARRQPEAGELDQRHARVSSENLKGAKDDSVGKSTTNAHAKSKMNLAKPTTTTRSDNTSNHTPQAQGKENVAVVASSPGITPSPTTAESNTTKTQQHPSHKPPSSENYYSTRPIPSPTPNIPNITIVNAEPHPHHPHQHNHQHHQHHNQHQHHQHEQHHNEHEVYDVDDDDDDDSASNLDLVYHHTGRSDPQYAAIVTPASLPPHAAYYNPNAVVDGDSDSDEDEDEDVEDHAQGPVATGSTTTNPPHHHHHHHHHRAAAAAAAAPPPPPVPPRRVILHSPAPVPPSSDQTNTSRILQDSVTQNQGLPPDPGPGPAPPAPKHHHAHAHITTPTFTTTSTTTTTPASTGPVRSSSLPLKNPLAIPHHTDTHTHTDIDKVNLLVASTDDARIVPFLGGGGIGGGGIGGGGGMAAAAAVVIAAGPTPTPSTPRHVKRAGGIMDVEKFLEMVLAAGATGSDSFLVETAVTSRSSTSHMNARVTTPSDRESSTSGSATAVGTRTRTRRSGSSSAQTYVVGRGGHGGQDKDGGLPDGAGAGRRKGRVNTSITAGDGGLDNDSDSHSHSDSESSSSEEEEDVEEGEGEGEGERVHVIRATSSRKGLSAIPWNGDGDAMRRRRRRDGAASLKRVEVHVQVEVARTTTTSATSSTTTAGMGTGSAIGSARNMDHCSQLNEIMNQPVTPEQEKELLQAVEEKRRLEARGARANNKSATLDANASVARIQEEMQNLSERTGVKGVAFFSRSHVNDSFIPSWTNTEGSLPFVSEVLGFTPAEVSQKMEMWHCVDVRDVPDKVPDLRTACKTMIKAGLERITGRKGLDMSYVNYDVDIRARFKVQIHDSWPARVKFVAPANLTRRDDLRELYERLVSGETLWRKMQAVDIQELKTTQANAPPKPPKKRRRDFGTTRSGSLAKQLPPGALNSNVDEEGGEDEDAAGSD